MTPAPAPAEAKSGAKGWLAKGKNKEIAIGGGVVLLIALYEKYKSGSTTASTASTAATTATPTAATGTLDASGEYATLEDEIQNLGAQIQAVQSSIGAGSSSSGTTPATDGTPEVEKDLYDVEQAEAKGDHASANQATHEAWLAAKSPKGLPIFQEPYAGSSPSAGTPVTPATGGGAPAKPAPKGKATKVKPEPTK